MDRPENDSGRPEDRPERHREKDINSQTVTDSSRVVNADRKPLDRRGDVYLFKVSCGRLIRYEVEHGSCRWGFNLLFPAMGKFERLAAKQKKGAARE
jgi:hypothetical protein